MLDLRAERGGLVTDWAFTLPDEVWAIPEAERSEKARFNNDLCQFDNRNFIRYVLDVPFAEVPGSFGWGAWAEVDWPRFERYLKLYDEDGIYEPTRTGKLANALAAYPGSLGTPVVIQFRGPSKRPSLYLSASNEGILAREQTTGIGETDTKVRNAKPKSYKLADANRLFLLVAPSGGNCGDGITTTMAGTRRWPSAPRDGR